MRRHIRLTLVALAVLAGCDAGEEPMEDPPTYDELRERVFATSCAFATCHIGASPAGGLNLDGDPFDQLVDTPALSEDGFVRVEPGNADASYVMLKLEGRNVVGDSMPPGAPLDEERLSLVRDWIAAGAIR